MPSDRARSAAKTAEEQARGTARNWREVLGKAQLDDFLPETIAGFIQELIDVVPAAFGRGSAYRQISASIIMIVIAVVLTPFTLGFSILLAFPFVVTLLIGIARLTPAVNERYRELRGDRLRDGDLRRWRRD